MNGSTWAQLWSGVIGAVIGAVAAAAVASYVLRKTLAAQQALSAEALALQRTLAAEASEKQAELAERQLREQKSALDAQLAEQRVGLEKQIAAQARLAQDAQRKQQHQAHVDAVRQQQALSLQLKEQREEAAKARAFAAIADLVSSADALVNGFNGGVEDVEQSFLAMRAAVVRWSLDLDSPELKEELSLWPMLMWHLAVHTKFEEQLDKSGRPGTGLNPFVSLSRAKGTLSVCVQNWPSASVDSRSTYLHVLAEGRKEGERSKSEYEKATSLFVTTPRTGE